MPFVDLDSVAWVEVPFAGETFLVSPDYVYPIGIGAAAKLASELGCVLPSPELVSEIWRVADLRLDPLPRRHDGTPRTMASAVVYADQARKINAQIAGRSFRLLAGTHKDIVTRNGKVGIYGWHRANGVPIQPFFAGHAAAWVDYSQGLRLVKRV